MIGTNFKDEVTGEEFSISSFSSVINSNGSVTYKDKWRKELVNPATGNKLVLIEKNTGEPIKVPFVAKFTATSREGQKNLKEHFGSRAQKFDSKGAGMEEKKEKVQKFQGQIIERAKEGKL